MLSWKSNVNPVYKTHITNTDVAELTKFMAIVKYGLFSIYSCPLQEDLLYVSSILAITNQSKMKRVLNSFLSASEYTSRNELATLYGKRGSYFKYESTNSSEIVSTEPEELSHRFVKYIFKTALVNIAIGIISDHRRIKHGLH